MDIENMLPRNALMQYDALAASPEGKDYTCPTCGYVPAKEVTLAGKTRYIRQICPCQKRARERAEAAERENTLLMHYATRAYKWLGDQWTDTPLMQKTFYTFDETAQPEGAEAARQFVGIFAGSLVLYGPYGTGKTHLLAALCNQVVKERKVSPLFTTAPKLFTAINARISAKEDYSRVLAEAIHTPLLLIDDVDKAKWTEFREEIYFAIVDERVKAGRPLALSTNHISKLPEYVGGAIASRLKIGQIAVEMVGNDYRENMGI